LAAKHIKWRWLDSSCIGFPQPNGELCTALQHYVCELVYIVLSVILFQRT